MRVLFAPLSQQLLLFPPMAPHSPQKPISGSSSSVPVSVDVQAVDVQTEALVAEVTDKDVTMVGTGFYIARLFADHRYPAADYRGDCRRKD